MLTKAQITIIGTKPILFCTFPVDTLSSSKSKEGGTGSNKEEWKKTVLMMPNRQLYVNSSYIIKSITEGAKLIKEGRGSISKKVGASLTGADDKILITNRFVPEEDKLTSLDQDDVYIDMRSVVNPMTKGRNIRYRIAAKAGWELTTTLIWHPRLASSDQIKESAINAGLMEGIGDGRKIGFGRFEVKEFKVLK